jgi:hypothetical protein
MQNSSASVLHARSVRPARRRLRSALLPARTLHDPSSRAAQHRHRSTSCPTSPTAQAHLQPRRQCPLTMARPRMLPQRSLRTSRRRIASESAWERTRTCRLRRECREATVATSKISSVRKSCPWQPLGPVHAPPRRALLLPTAACRPHPHTTRHRPSIRRARPHRPLHRASPPGPASSLPPHEAPHLGLPQAAPCRRRSACP